MAAFAPRPPRARLRADSPCLPPVTRPPEQALTLLLVSPCGRSEYIFPACCMPGAGLGPGDTMVSKTDRSPHPVERAVQNSGLKPQGRPHQLVPRSPRLPETPSSHPVLSSSSQHGPLLLQGQCRRRAPGGAGGSCPCWFPAHSSQSCGGSHSPRSLWCTLTSSHSFVFSLCCRIRWLAWSIIVILVNINIKQQY